MPDSQQYLLNLYLINNVEDIAEILSHFFKKPVTTNKNNQFL